MSQSKQTSADFTNNAPVVLDPTVAAFGSKDTLNTLGRTHFIGIGGAGMSVLAEMLHEQGVEVTGSDREPSVHTERLQSLGISVFFGQRSENVRGATTVVYSSAIKPDNPEIVEAARLGTHIVHRSDILALLMAGKRAVTVAGAHGKTTTSSLLAHILVNAGTGTLADPSYAIGGSIQTSQGAPLEGGHAGDGDVLVAEADESDGSFGKYSPQIALMVNAEADHLDHYGDVDNYRNAFVAYAGHSRGQVVMSLDDEGSRAIFAALPNEVADRTICYTMAEDDNAVGTNASRDSASRTAVQVVSETGSNGIGNDDASRAARAAMSKGAHVVRILAEREHAGDGIERFAIRLPKGFNGMESQTDIPVALQVPGAHNARNATAAIIAAVLLGMDAGRAAQAASGFLGASRRFEIKGIANGVTVVDDYAHHPTEITALLKAARRRYPQATIHVLFQPHLFSRTKFFTQQFAQALGLADDVVVTSIYPARERQEDFAEVRPDNIVVAANGLNHDPRNRWIRVIENMREAALTLARQAKSGDVIITVGAGDVTAMGGVMLDALNARTREAHR
ncbi:UDP-N-acetylmuramate--L-alanine ligase [Bifidobacterium bohemicum]|uniref:UDP-N-acetylmuramate--L-alanine ligase n=1 Tax=Bifidobacterium bohemicum DSM 22767 TaxID=1437606 RepID=A0A086ZGF0_9BIFI|nr:Mur ligase domain-containing protein [Bifidobacterium bohemicum]KFI45600.1 UDP-N-acetylmuramate--L-alanine ligase [Bifidobacterium bohemicum DSM 22767]SCC00976.1 UDP-N-acetylmuramate--L-alanine ligase [Bifidobacterium bohemicum]